ncbi:MAG: tetratricopeptide repeat protein [Acidobacteria bacterium]|nr:tetratricopeptide repeat protein [Acidobacteriota bacterium]
MTYSKCIFSLGFLLAGLNGFEALAQPMFSAQARAAGAVSGAVVRMCEKSQDNSFQNLRVELTSRQNLNQTYFGDVRWDGTFEIRDVSEGVYEAQVTNQRGSVLKRTLFTVNTSGGGPEVRLELPCAEKQAAGGVSLRRLTHKPPKSAVKALRRAGEAQVKGDLAAWEKHLREAVRLDPEFFEARNNLGAFLARANRTEEALNEFRAALEIDPRSAPVLNNLSASMLNLHQPREAEAFARKALAIDPLSPQGHYLLGVALVNQNRFTEEAAGHLRDSTPTFPKARQVEAAVREHIRRQSGE